MATVVDARHCAVVGGDNWQTVATQLGVTRNALLTANGESLSNPTSLTVGRIIHRPT